MVESSKPSGSVLMSNPKKRAGDSRKACARASEHYDALLRQLQFRLQESSGLGEVPQALGVTSRYSGEGVTTIAVNLALAAVNAMRQPVLLVDANVRRASLHKILRLSMTDGLVGAFSGESHVFDCIVESHIDKLSLLPAGKPPSGREPVLQAGILEDTLDNLKHVFPLIIVDLPPATEFTACFALARKLDGVLLVIEAMRVDRESAERAKCGLSDSGANLVGAVFNKR